MKFLRIILFSFIVVLHALPASGGSGILYAVNPLRESVDVYDTNALMRVDRISVGKDPSDIALSPDRRLLAVTHRGTDIESPQVLWIIDREKKEVVDKVYVFLTRYRERGEVHPLFSQDGKKIYIVEDEKDSTGFLNVVIASGDSKWRLVKRLNLCEHPRKGILSGDGKTLYIPCLYSRKIMVVDTEADRIADVINVIGMPSAIALSADEKTAYVTDRENHRVLFIDLATHKTVKEIAVGSAPGNLVLADERHLYVFNTHSNNLSIVDVERKENIMTRGMGILPEKIAYDPSKKLLYIVSGPATISIVDTSAPKKLQSIPADFVTNIVLAP